MAILKSDTIVFDTRGITGGVLPGQGAAKIGEAQVTFGASTPPAGTSPTAAWYNIVFGHEMLNNVVCLQTRIDTANKTVFLDCSVTPGSFVSLYVNVYVSYE